MAQNAFEDIEKMKKRLSGKMGRVLLPRYLKDARTVEEFNLLLPYVDKENERMMTSVFSAFTESKDIEVTKILLPYINTDKQKQAICSALKKSQNVEIIKFLSQYTDREDEEWMNTIRSVFEKSKSPEITKLLLPYVNKEDNRWIDTIRSVFEQSVDDKQVEILLPFLDIKQEDIQSLLTKVHSKSAVEYLINRGAHIQEQDIISIMERTKLFHNEFEKQIGASDGKEKRTVILQTGLGDFEISVHDAKVAYGEYYQKIFENYPEKMSTEDVYKAFAYIDSYSPSEVDHAMHTMCHCFEDGSMRDKDNRTKGNIVLDKVLQMMDEGCASYNAPRCLSGYWNSAARIDTDAQVDMRKILEKYSHNPKCLVYLELIDGKKEDNLADKRRKYTENEEMLFVDTIMVDIDGTLLTKDGKLNLPLIKDLKDVDYEIYTGGDPEKQRHILLKACGVYEERLKSTRYEEDENEAIKAFKAFKSRLWADCNIYPKNAFMQDDICLARGVFDDTVPENQGIKSLVSYGYVDKDVHDKIPDERRITAAQVLEIYQGNQEIKKKIVELLKRKKGGEEQTSDTHQHREMSQIPETEKAKVDTSLENENSYSVTAKQVKSSPSLSKIIGHLKGWFYSGK